MKTTANPVRRAVVSARRKFSRPARRRTLYNLLKDFDGVIADLPMTHDSTYAGRSKSSLSR